MEPEQKEITQSVERSKAVRLFTPQEQIKIISQFGYIYGYVHVTPYDRTISFSGIQLKGADFPPSIQYRKIIIDSYPNNPFIKLLKVYQKDTKLIKKISKIAKDEGKTVYEAILDYVNHNDLTKSFSDHILEISKIPPRLGSDAHYPFYALVLTSEIINTLVSFGIEPELILFDTIAQNLISTRLLQELAHNFYTSRETDFEFDHDNLEQTIFRFLIRGEEEQVIRLFESYPELLDDKIAKLDTAVRYGRAEIVKYILDSIDFDTMNNDLYIEFYNSFLQAIIRGHPQICLQFIAPEIWNIFNEDQQVNLLILITTRTGIETKEILIDNLIENGLFAYCLFAQVMSRNSDSPERLQEISEAFHKYQSGMMFTMIKTVLNAANKKPEDPTKTVFKISGVVALTKYFTRESKQEAINKIYEDIKPFLTTLREEYTKLDRSKNKHHHIFLDLVLKAVEKNAEKVFVAVEKEIVPTAEPITKVITLKKSSPKKQKTKKATFVKQEEKKDADVDAEELTTSNNQDLDDDRGGEKIKISPIEEVVQSKEEDSSVQQAEVKVSEEKPVLVQKSWAEVVAVADSKLEAPQTKVKVKEEKLVLVQKSWAEVVAVDYKHQVELPQQPVIAEEELPIISEEVAVPVISSVSSSASDDKHQVEVPQQPVIADEELPLISEEVEVPVIDRVISPVSSSASDDNHQVEVQEQPVIADEDVVFQQPPIQTIRLDNPVIAKDNHKLNQALAYNMPLNYFNYYLGYYQQSYLQTQWFCTNGGKLIYSLLITNPNSSISNYYIDPTIGGVANLTIEEHRSLKPSSISTENHQIFLWPNNVFTIIEMNQLGIKFFEYSIDPIAGELLRDTIVVDSIPVDSSVEESVAQPSSSVQGSQQSEQGKQQSSSAGQNAGQNNLSNNIINDREYLLILFKEKVIKFIELLLPSSTSLDNIDTTNSEEQEKKENEEAIQKRLEEKYAIIMENLNNKVNTSDYEVHSHSTSELLKTLLGEHDSGVKFSASYSAFSSHSE